ncbi:histidine kinase dimerization/phosphoacceptor domain -containing protein [Reichenbachiella versicolor]|uniref:histidine kinase dimerization/phosphoacceptor domain -containing protein n=1 Tax=Reichenbachiella versicolor TaxID=1821036 RepID=UPI000D6E9ED8|nr:histidine kinase dimerization/phosphoacceptor domain -containing protein [Reichenbachiella versicolor]
MKAKNVFSSFEPVISIIKKMVHTGAAKQPLDQRPIIHLLNSTALLAIVVILLTQIISIPLMGVQIYSFLFSLFFLVQSAGIIRMNQLGKIRSAKGLFLFGCYTSVFTLHVAYDVEVASWVFLICLYSYFGAILKKKRNLIFHSVLTTVLAICSIVLHHIGYFKPLTATNQHEVMSLHIMMFVCTSLFVLANMHSLRVNLSNHQEQLEKMLSEKKLLLKEVHHRVNNNLQLISSLLNIQGRQVTDAKSGWLYGNDAIQSRIQSMAIIHHELSNIPEINAVPLRRYVKNLTTHLGAIFEVDRRNIELDIEIADVYIKPEKVVHFGLIITEILTNTFKHAFPEGKSGKVLLRYTENGSTQTLLIQDNGQGFTSQDLQRKYFSGIGLELISDLAAQLNGSHVMEEGEGVRHIITIDEEVVLHAPLIDSRASALVLEDDEIIARDICEVLKEQSITTTKVHSYDQAMAAIENGFPDLIFCDINLSDEKTGLDFVKVLLEKASWTKVVIITAYTDLQTLKSTLPIKPSNYLVKPFTKSQLATTAQLTMEEVKKMEGLRKVFDGLTLQELKILKLVAREQPSAKIASELNISEKTVRNHRYNIVKKLNIPNKKNSLVMWAIQHRDHLL